MSKKRKKKTLKQLEKELKEKNIYVDLSKSVAFNLTKNFKSSIIKNKKKDYLKKLSRKNKIKY